MRDFRAEAIALVAKECGWTEEKLGIVCASYADLSGQFDDVGMAVAVRETERRLRGEALIREMDAAIEYSLRVGYNADDCGDHCGNGCYWCELRSQRATAERYLGGQ